VKIGPQNGTLTLHTGRAGAAAKVGHDLTLAIGRWSLEGDPTTTMTLVAELDSLTVVKGEGGLKPLSDKDKSTIVANALETLKAKQHPTVRVTVAGVSGHSETVTGSVTIAGREAQVALTVEATEGDPAEVLVTAVLPQSAFGIKPYSGLLGTLKVADDVGIRLKLSVPRV
jgi:hypothetical protein